MILRFNTELFCHDDPQVKSKVARILLETLDEKYIWDQESLDELFLSEDENSFFKIPFGTEWISEGHQKELFFKIEQAFRIGNYVTSLHKKYLTTVRVGFGENELHPDLVYELLSKPSKIILENSRNDWKFFVGMCNKYVRNSPRKEIYRLISKAIQNNWLVPENAGGKGDIRNCIRDFRNNQYKGILKYKIAVMFDSDRPDADSLMNEQKLIVEFFKNRVINGVDEASCDENDSIVWHILYKREIENYLPKEIMLQIDTISEPHKDLIQNYTPQEYDFIDFEATLQEIQVKNVIPEYFRNEWATDLIERRCIHHRVNIPLPNGTLTQVSEIESLLLKIAKII